MADDFSAKVLLRDVAIVGGGCYGTFYAGQLIQARERGKAEYRRLLVMDRDPDCRFGREIGAGDDRELVVEDWGRFFDRWLGPGRRRRGRRHRAVAPHAPSHVRVAGPPRPGSVARTTGGASPARADAGTPYDMLAPDGTRYVSFADWLCPMHCIEPAICPVIRAPRSWEMSDAAQRLVERRARQAPSAGPVLFVCRHRVHGVGMFDVAAVLAGDARWPGSRRGRRDAGMSWWAPFRRATGPLSLLHLGGAACDRGGCGNPCAFYIWTMQ